MAQVFARLGSAREVAALHELLRGPSDGLAGVGSTADFAVGLGFLGDARRTGAFFAGFFLTVVVFLRVAALTGAFFRFALVLPLASFLVAIYSLPEGLKGTRGVTSPHSSPAAV